jgi:Raf kinase inhibitor-like YbhB/YbcL family protein
VEDPDAQNPPLPVVHWIAWNIPANTLSLREGLEALERLEEPDGLRQGVNSSGAVGYRGPKPPEGDPPHHYHFQVFAIDNTLHLRLGATREELLAALKGHVRASGELEGSFARPAHPAKL